jgi:hypothetical protein
MKLELRTPPSPGTRDRIAARLVFVIGTAEGRGVGSRNVSQREAMLDAKRLSLLLVLGLLLAVLVGPGMVAGAGPRTTVVESIMIPAAEFLPTLDDWDYQRGPSIFVESGVGRFTASIPLPALVVSIRRITLYAYDNSDSADVSVTLYRHAPAAGEDFVDLGGVATAGAAATDPQVQYTTAISPRTVDRTRFGLFLWLRIPEPGLKVYGVKVTYAYETGT